MKLRLSVLNFLQFAVWGAYLTSMGGYLASVGIGANIGWFYSAQGFVSIIMPALMGIIADRYMQAQRLLSLSHLVAGLSMIGLGVIGQAMGDRVTFSDLFPVYLLSIAFYMPTLALTNSVCYNALDRAKLDAVKAFPPIRIFGTIGFICSMWIVSLLGYETTHVQFFVSGAWSIVMCCYSLTMPACPVNPKKERQSLYDAFGLKAFSLFKTPRMAIFFVFSMLLGCCLQITNGYAGPFIQSFAAIDEYKDLFFVSHSNLLISLSQISETLCILLIPFFLGRFGIKRVMLIAMFAWMFRFGFFAIGDPSGGIWALILSMIVYGVAFDFFNISGSLFVDNETDIDIRSSAQGVFMLMTNGLGASIGMIGAQTVVNSFTVNESGIQVGDWTSVWWIFSAYALVVAVAFALLFRSEKQ